MEAELLPSPSLDRLFSVLADGRRRRVLSLLTGRQERRAVADLARSIAHLERGGGATEPAGSSVRSVAVSLHHVHLPMLDDAGLIEYDPGAGTVSRTRRSERFESIVETATRTEREVTTE